MSDNAPEIWWEEASADETAEENVFSTQEATELVSTEGVQKASAALRGKVKGKKQNESVAQVPSELQAPKTETSLPVPEPEVVKKPEETTPSQGSSKEQKEKQETPSLSGGWQEVKGVILALSERTERLERALSEEQQIRRKREEQLEKALSTIEDLEYSLKLLKEQHRNEMANLESDLRKRVDAAVASNSGIPDLVDRLEKKASELFALVPEEAKATVKELSLSKQEAETLESIKRLSRSTEKKKKKLPLHLL